MMSGVNHGRTMRERGLNELVAALPTDWLENYVETFEAGRVQRHPRARFVTEEGECCLVAAMAAARSGHEFTRSKVWSWLLGTELEELSRRFEARRVSGQELYDETLLALARRRAGPAVEPAEVAAMDAAIALSA